MVLTGPVTRRSVPVRIRKSARACRTTRCGSCSASIAASSVGSIRSRRPSSRRSTASRSAAGSSSRSCAICASRRSTRSSGCRRRRSASFPGAGGTQRLPRLVGEARAKELILLGKRISASHALAFGLVNRVSRPGTNVLDDTLEWIKPDHRRSADRAARGADGDRRDARRSSFPEGSHREAALYEQCLVSEDRTEALRAFAARTKPIVQGEMNATPPR